MPHDLTMKASFKASTFCTFLLASALPSSLMAGEHNGTSSYGGTSFYDASGVMSAFTGGGRIDSIVEQANRSGQCRDVQEKSETSQVPVDFLKGMGYSLVRSLCGRKDSGVAGLGLSDRARRDSVKGTLEASPGLYSAKDVLNNSAYRSYAVEQTGSRNAAATYAILASLAMQESDANILEKIDTSKSANLQSKKEEEEVAAFQMSANSQNLLNKAVYQELLRSYLSALKSASSNPMALEKVCRVGKYTANGQKNPKEKFNPNTLIQKLQSAVVGIDINASKLTDQQFLDLNSTCPAFATEYAALVARANLAHNGPLVRAEVKPSEGCIKMFQDLSALGTEPSVCDDVGL